MASTVTKPNPFRRIAIFCAETVEEFRKASWPDWEELRNSTTLVIATVALLGFFICASDTSLVQLVIFITHLAVPGK